MISTDDTTKDSGEFAFTKFLPELILLGGFLARLWQAWRYFLNPDEALHYFLSSQPSVGMAYKAALTNAHPPLLILVLYYWRGLGHSELMLRMPSLLAGTACCWITYQWLKLVANRSTAFVGLLLFTFAPALVGLSAEIRQYALLLFFMSGCLYCSERALRDNSQPWMILFSGSLYGALLVHYSSLLFAFNMGVYMLVRLYPYGRRLGLSAVWAVGQVGGVTISAYFLITHVMRLRQNGMVQTVFDTYLQRSIFHAGEMNFVSFIAAQTLRVFTYLFSHGVVGTLALLAFLIGTFLLLWGKVRLTTGGPSPRQLALLLGLPFVANCAAALAGQYPYGGTRHSAVLLLFAVTGASIGLASLGRSRRWMTYTIVVALIVCNVFPAPPPPIRARNQARTLMHQAVNSFRQSAAPGSVVVADYQSALLFGYYVCGHSVVQIFPPLSVFSRKDCGSYSVIATEPQEWKFYANDFAGNLTSIANTHGLAPQTRVWLFDAGWIVDSTPALRQAIEPLGCSAPQTFGENVFLCSLTVGAGTDSAQK